MNASTEHVEDRLLELAYGELGAEDARAVEAHVADCPSCRASLDEIRGVRQVMAKLPQPAAPQAGLESLLAYANQTARRAQAGPAKKPWWRMWTFSVAGVMAVTLFGIVVLEVTKDPEFKKGPSEAVFEDRAQAAKPAMAAPTVAAPAESAEPGVVGAVVEAREAAPARRARIEEDQPKKKSVVAAKKPVTRKKPETRNVAAFDRAEAPASNDEGAAFGAGGRASAAPSSPLAGAASPPPSAPAPAAAAPMRAPVQAQRADDLGGLAEEETSAVRKPSSVPLLHKDAERVAEAKKSRSSAPSTYDSVSKAESAAPSAEAAERDAAASEAERRYALAVRFSADALAANSAGNRSLEIANLNNAVAAKPPDSKLMSDLLLRLCEAELAVGNVAKAQAACERVQREYGTSRAAERARSILASIRARSEDVKPAATGH